MVCVLPGVDDVLAKPLRLVSILMSEDLPTFDLPINTNSGLGSAGHLFTSVTDIKNVASFTINSFCIELVVLFMPF
jgi:hypothetical protein